MSGQKFVDIGNTKATMKMKLLKFFKAQTKSATNPWVSC